MTHQNSVFINRHAPGAEQLFGKALEKTFSFRRRDARASRVGFGSALATIMLLVSVVFIVIYLSTVLREEER